VNLTDLLRSTTARRPVEHAACMECTPARYRRRRSNDPQAPLGKAKRKSSSSAWALRAQCLHGSLCRSEGLDSWV
jgi:hypothetical protein